VNSEGNRQQSEATAARERAAIHLGLERARALVDAEKERVARENLRGQWGGSRPSEGAGELGEDGQVGVKPNPLKATDTERQ
jgi:hypothetical protein